MVTVCTGSVTGPPTEFVVFVAVHGTMYGVLAFITNLSTPRITRRMVFSASGLTALTPYRLLISSFVAKME